MKPYYEDGSVVLYHGDCREVLPTLTAGCVFADPPYNSGLSYGEGTDDNRADYWSWLGERIEAMRAAARVVVVKHSALKMADFLSRWPSRVAVWHKPFSSGFPNRGLMTHWEPLYVVQGDAVVATKDVVTISAGNTNREAGTGHPAQFPEDLGRWLVATFCRPDETFVDPFMGSGTTIVAAKSLNRRAVGIEVEERWCETAANRLRQEVLGLVA